VASPADAIELLERAAPPQDLPTDALETLVNLRIATEQAALGDAASVLVSRHLAAGRLADAAATIDRCERYMHPADAIAIVEQAVVHVSPSGRELDEDELLVALTLEGVLERSVRAIRPLDLPSAIEAIARFRAALTPVPDEVDQALAPLETDLLDAWDSTETHRAALVEAEQSLIPAIREALHGKRLLIVGGRRPNWWDDTRQELGLSDKSAWVQSEPGHRPSMKGLKATVGAGKVDLVLIITDYIAHATSAINEFAADRGVPVLEARSGRLSFLTALRGRNS
jgi:hypothetical protein